MDGWGWEDGMAGLFLEDFFEDSELFMWNVIVQGI